MGFSYIKLKFQKYSICIPLRAFLVYFKTKNQHNATLRPSEEEVRKAIGFSQVFIYNNKEDFAKIFLFYFNKKQGSNQLNILVGCNLSFINASYLEMDG